MNGYISLPLKHSKKSQHSLLDRPTFIRGIPAGIPFCSLALNSTDDVLKSQSLQ